MYPCVNAQFGTRYCGNMKVEYIFERNDGVYVPACVNCLSRFLFLGKSIKRYRKLAPKELAQNLTQPF